MFSIWSSFSAHLGVMLSDFRFVEVYACVYLGIGDCVLRAMQGITFLFLKEVCSDGLSIWIDISTVVADTRTSEYTDSHCAVL